MVECQRLVDVLLKDGSAGEATAVMFWGHVSGWPLRVVQALMVERESSCLNCVEWRLACTRLCSSYTKTTQDGGFLCNWSWGRHEIKMKYIYSTQLKWLCSFFVSVDRWKVVCVKIQHMIGISAYSLQNTLIQNVCVTEKSYLEGVSWKLNYKWWRICPGCDNLQASGF